MEFSSGKVCASGCFGSCARHDCLDVC
jgi:hypothetical protein